jgi:hypothetical protein
MMENGRESGYRRKCFEIIQFLSSLMEISLFLIELGNSMEGGKDCFIYCCGLTIASGWLFCTDTAKE